jgi:pectate lyase
MDAAGQPGADAGGDGDLSDGAPVVPPAEGLCGWAAVAGDGVTTRTGGGEASPITVTTAEELLALAEDPEPRVIHIDGMLDTPALDVASNKTIVGVGSDSGIRGGIRIHGESLTERISNVIIRNLHVDGTTTDIEDGIQIFFAHHIWIDHVDVFDAPDGNLDVTHGSDNVTISSSLFHYTDAAPADHRFSNLIGHDDDNQAEDAGRLRVTFHHNWWADGVVERMPRMRFGYVHLLNNYYTSAGNNYCIGAGVDARAVVENNAFAGVNDPNILYDDEPSAGLTVFGNQYEGTKGLQNGDQGQPVSPLPDDYVACPTDSASDVPALVMAGAGPR